MSELSAQTKALLRAAREDGPSSAARAQIWSAVGTTSAAGMTALGSAAAKGAIVGGIGGATASAKMLMMGVLLGSAVTVGVAAFVVRIGPPALRPDPMYSVASEEGRERACDVGAGVSARAARPEAADGAEAAAGAVTSAGRGGRSAGGRDEPPARGDGLLAPAAPGALVRRSPEGAPVAAHVAVNDARVPRSISSKRAEADDLLAREAQLLAEARGALVRGQPVAALSALRAARALPVRALEPETLSLEAHALRAEGHFDEADQTEARLRERFPDHALAR